MSSDFRVPYTTILDIQPHNNADRLSVATVYGFQVIIPKDSYEIGQKVVYIPIDSILTCELESILFPPTAKIVLHKSRVRQIKIRGLASQGMIVNPKDLSELINFDNIELETDLSKKLYIEKYEPPAKGPAQTQGKPGGRKALANPNFHKYNGLSNIKWLPNTFKEGDEVVIQCKLHGTNARFGYLPYVPNTLWKKIKQFFKFSPEFEYCYGSNNVDISNSISYNGFYGEDVYGTAFKKIDAFNKVKENETIFGEIIGPGIQKGYTYGLKEPTFVLFDVKILQKDGTQTWLDPDKVEAYAKERGFEMVPILYKGPYNKNLAYKLTFGASEYGDKSEPIREGIVIKSAKNYDVNGNKQALKWISEDYLAIKDNTDFH